MPSTTLATGIYKHTAICLCGLRAAFTADGWFKTGDIGLFTSDGCIRIVDRLKNLVKLKGGEYIAIENMEAVYGGAGVVNALNGGVLCYGTGDMDRPVALVQVDIAALKKWADGAGVAYKSAEALRESGAFDVVEPLHDLVDVLDLQVVDVHAHPGSVFSYSLVPRRPRPP